MTEPGKKTSLLQRAWAWAKGAFRGAVQEFREKGLRWSYLAVGVLVVIATAVNLLLPHGWTAWPFVAAAAILMYVHEAAERNGQGVPPGHVYAWFAGVVAVWILVAAVLSVVNPLIVLAGVGYLCYYCGAAYLREREVRRVIDERRAAGQCIVCGEVADPRLGVCMNCGEEPDPIAAQTARVQAVVKNRSGAQRARAVLTRESLAAAARKKEAKLLSRSGLRNRQRK